MKYVSDKLEQFDLRDHDWTLDHWTGDSLAVRVDGPGILSGEHAGRQAAQALVTFRGIHVLEAGTHDGQRDLYLSIDGARDLFARETLFVFSYGADSQNCEFCGLGVETVLFLNFDFRTVTVEWDAFAPELSEPLVGELRKL